MIISIVSPSALIQWTIPSSVHVQTGFRQQENKFRGSVVRKMTKKREKNEMELHQWNSFYEDYQMCQPFSL